MLVCIPLKLFAQNDTLKGYVYGIQSFNPIKNALIKVEDGTGFSTSGEDGSFQLLTTKKTGSIIVSAKGFISKKIHYDVTKNCAVLLASNARLFNTVTITAYGNKTNKETAGAIAVLSAKRLRPGNGTSLQTALNSVPGVKMDQSTLSDSRISIRGNGIRSPWGIRNIKIYINDIPLTEADGTTRLEAVDVNDLGKAEIIRGPASSLYGAGTGGVIKFKLAHSPYQEQSISSEGIVGSYGLGRLSFTYKQSNNKMNSYVSYGHQVYDGYRTHSSDKKDFLVANFQFTPTKKQLITLLVSRSSQHTQIPGALTMDQVSVNRRQANPTYLEKEAGRNQHWTRIGIGQRYHFSKNFSNSTALFTYFYDLNHPLPFAYIRNFFQSYGGRTVFGYDANFKLFPTHFSFGGEYNHAISKGTMYVNNFGNEGNIVSNTDYDDLSYFLFAQADVSLLKKLTLSAGVSYNSLRYRAHDYFATEKSGLKQFHPQASPRMALSYDFGSFLSLHASVSSGFSAPTHNQIQNADGSINLNLQAQEAVNYEINAKGNFVKSRLAYDLAAFYLDMKGELIGQSLSNGITVYRNSGKTVHTGIELALQWQVVRPSDNKGISLLQPYAAVTYSHFTFTDYKIRNAEGKVTTNYAGNWLTGIAPWTVSGGILLESKWGFYGNINYYFNASSPLNDANSTFNKAYQLLSMKVGYQKILWKHFGFDVYLGANNITNQLYSSFTALNAVSYGGTAPAYYNPSPERNYYVGAKLTYFIHQ